MVDARPDGADAVGQPTGHRHGLALLALLGVTVVWGSTFTVVKDAIGRMPAMDFLAIRFTLAAVVLLALRPPAIRNVGADTLRHGVLLGVILGGGYVAQTVGLERTTPAVSGFVTGLFVVLTPILAGILLHNRVGPGVWASVALATAGLAVLSLRGAEVGLGELLTLACAVAFALHIVGLSVWAGRHEVWALAIVQLVTAATLCTIGAAPDGISMPPDGGVWAALGLTAVLATSVAYAIQTWAQRRLKATQVALVLTMEPVFAGVFAVWLAGEALTWPLAVGGAAIVAAMYLAEAASRREQRIDEVERRRSGRTSLDP